MALFKRKENTAKAEPQKKKAVVDYDDIFANFDALGSSIKKNEAPMEYAANYVPMRQAPSQPQYAPVQRTERVVAHFDVSAMTNSKCVKSVGLSTHIGKRDSQQDSAAVINYDIKDRVNDKWMAILCDGMGGMNGGERASALCVERMFECFNDIGDQAMGDFLANSIVDIDDRVARIKDDDGNYLGAGSTFITTIMVGDTMYFGSVGDSHLYIIRGNNMQLINQEHNYFADLLEKVQAGEITMEQAVNDKSKDALTSFMGIGGISLMDINMVKLEKNDYIILCSDGLYRSVTDDEMFKIICANSDNMQNAADELVNAALAKGKKYQDNTTVITIRFE